MPAEEEPVDPFKYKDTWRSFERPENPGDFDPDVPLEPYYLYVNLGSVTLAEERGCWYSVRRFLDGRIFANIERFADAEVREYLAGVRSRLAEAEAYEGVHGKGSLLKLDHPWNAARPELIANLIAALRKDGQEGQPRAA